MFKFLECQLILAKYKIFVISYHQGDKYSRVQFLPRHLPMCFFRIYSIQFRDKGVLELARALKKLGKWVQ